MCDMKCRLEMGRYLERSSDGSEYFFTRGLTRAVLKEVGKLTSESERFFNLVTGRRRASIQDLRSLVGKTSRGQVEFDEERIA